MTPVEFDSLVSMVKTDANISENLPLFLEIFTLEFNSMGLEEGVVLVDDQGMEIS
jgi:hypothetical protein